MQNLVIRFNLYHILFIHNSLYWYFNDTSVSLDDRNTAPKKWQIQKVPTYCPMEFMAWISVFIQLTSFNIILSLASGLWSKIRFHYFNTVKKHNIEKHSPTWSCIQKFFNRFSIYSSAEIGGFNFITFGILIRALCWIRGTKTKMVQRHWLRPFIYLLTDTWRLTFGMKDGIYVTFFTFWFFNGFRRELAWTATLCDWINRFQYIET